MFEFVFIFIDANSDRKVLLVSGRSMRVVFTNGTKCRSMPKFLHPLGYNLNQVTPISGNRLLILGGTLREEEKIVGTTGNKLDIYVQHLCFELPFVSCR